MLKSFEMGRRQEATIEEASGETKTKADMTYVAAQRFLLDQFLGL